MDDSNDARRVFRPRSATMMSAARVFHIGNGSNDDSKAHDRLQTAQDEWRKIFAQEMTNSDKSLVNRELFLTRANQRTNVFWGDELLKKGEDIFRV